MAHSCITVFSVHNALIYDMLLLLGIKYPNQMLVLNFSSLWETMFPGWQRSVQLSCSVMSDCLWLHGLLHARLPCLSPTPWAYSNSCPWSWWCHPTISSSVTPFSSCLYSVPASGSFPMSQFFASCGQSIRVSASISVLPMTIQDWFLLGLTGWNSLQF